jgi:hypothetical protein
MSIQGSLLYCALLGELSLGQVSGPPKVVGGYGKVPPAFEENRGQVDQAASYFLRGRNLNLFVTKTGAVLGLKKGETRAAIRLEVVGASGDGVVAGEAATGGVSSYFQGTDPAKWVTGAKQFGKVRVSGVRAGLDFVCYPNENRLEYDLVVKAGSRVENARVRFVGAERVSIAADGELRIQTAAGELAQKRPHVWQDLDGRRMEIPGQYKVSPAGEVSVVVGKYDRSHDLVIDPVISYSTYLGGIGMDIAWSIAVDGSGNAYVAGVTDSVNFPTTVGAYQVAHNVSTSVGFAAKLNASGTALLYSTFIGGSADTSCSVVTIDSSGNAYLVGTTTSIDFPVTAGAFQTSAIAGSSQNAFVTKLNATGTALVYSTYLSGSASQYGQAIQVDSTGNAYVAGKTSSGNFPTTAGAYSRSLKGASNAFLTKLNASGSQVVYSTYLGGSGYDVGTQLVLDTSQNVYIVGETVSPDFPTTTGAYQQSTPGANVYQGFASKISADGSTLLASTYLGGATIPFQPNTTEVSGVTLDSASNVYVVGETYSPAFPTTPNTYSFSPDSPNGFDYGHAFLTKLNPGLTALVYSTVFGGSGTDEAWGVAVDSSDQAYVTGYTSSPDFPITTGSLFPKKNGGSGYAFGSAFLTQFSASGASFNYSTLIAGTGTDGGNALAIDQNSGVYIVGSTGSADFPVTAGAYQTVAGGVQSSFSGPIYDAFVTKLDLSSPVSCSVAVSPLNYTGPSTGFSGSLTITTPAGCPWVIYNAYGEAVTINGPTHGIGSATVSFSVASTFGSSSQFSGSLLIGSASFPLAQYSCIPTSYSPLSATVQAGAGETILYLTSLLSGCAVVQSTSAPWLSYGGAGEGFLVFNQPSLEVFYEIARNPSTQPRTGTINYEGLTFTVTQAGAPPAVPSVVSVTPSAGSGSNQVFTAVFSDTGGGGALSGELFLINSSLNGSSACWVQVGPGGIYLYDDDSTPLVLGPMVAGGTYSNKQCTLSGTGSGLSTSGNNLTLTLSIRFKGVFAGPKNIYASASDIYGNSTGWRSVGSFTVGSAMPSVVSLTPDAGAGSSRVFSAVFSDTSGGSAIGGELFLINSTLNGSSACWVQVGPNGIYLYDDDSTPVVLGPIVAGGTYSNKQCTLNGSGSGVSTSGNNLTLTLSITFKGAFSGLKNIYALANDVYGNSTGWQTVGSFTVQSAMAVSVTPNAGSSSSQVFSAIFSDTTGGSAISGELFLINSTLNGSGACWVQVGPNGIYLYDDDSTPVVLGPIMAGGTYSNKQCTLNGTGSGVSTSGNNLTLTLSITFKGAFSGLKNIYALANDVYGNSTGWQTVGTFTLGSAMPSFVSLTPNAGSGSSQVFTAVFSDTAGGSAISGGSFLINSSLNGSSACWIQVGPSGIYLYDDDSTPVVLGPIVAGGTYSNKQCTLNGTGSAVSTSENNLTLTLSITFKGVFSGPKNIYALANDVYGNSTGWQTVGSFTP